jgi:urea carboxylase
MQMLHGLDAWKPARKSLLHKPTAMPRLSMLLLCCSFPPPAGAVFAGTLDGAPVPWNASFAVKQGQELALGQVDTSTGIRGYLAVAGGIDVPLYLGSRSTFPNGNFGGYQGR